MVGKQCVFLVFTEHEILRPNYACFLVLTVGNMQKFFYMHIVKYAWYTSTVRILLYVISMTQLGRK